MAPTLNCSRPWLPSPSPVNWQGWPRLLPPLAAFPLPRERAGLAADAHEPRAGEHPDALVLAHGALELHDRARAEAIVRRGGGRDLTDAGEEATQLRRLLHEDDRLPHARSGLGRLEAGEPAADDEHGLLDGLLEALRQAHLLGLDDAHAQHVLGQRLRVLVAGRVRPGDLLPEAHPLDGDLGGGEPELLL